MARQASLLQQLPYQEIHKKELQTMLEQQEKQMNTRACGKEKNSLAWQPLTLNPPRRRRAVAADQAPCHDRRPGAAPCILGVALGFRIAAGDSR